MTANHGSVLGVFLRGCVAAFDNLPFEVCGASIHNPHWLEGLTLSSLSVQVRRSDVFFLPIQLWNDPVTAGHLAGWPSYRLMHGFHGCNLPLLCVSALGEHTLCTAACQMQQASV